MTPAKRAPHGMAVALLLSALLGACAAPGAPEGAASAPAPAVATSDLRPIAITNPGFESDQVGARGNPEGWSAHQHVGPTAYAFTIDRATKHSGDASLRIRNLRPEVYGSITQQVPAAAHRGRTMRFSVWLRSEGIVANDYGKGATPLLQAFVGGSPAVSASFEVAADRRDDRVGAARSRHRGSRRGGVDRDRRDAHRQRHRLARRRRARSRAEQAAARRRPEECLPARSC